jgi:hypothetical protein
MNRNCANGQVKMGKAGRMSCHCFRRGENMDFGQNIYIGACVENLLCNMLDTSTGYYLGTMQ